MHQQPLAPLDNSVGASAAIVILPIILLFVLIFVTRVAYAAIIGLAATLIVACGRYSITDVLGVLL